MLFHRPRSPDRAGRTAPARSRAALARSLYVAVVVGALLTLSAWALASARPAEPATNATGDTALADDDAEGALFSLTGLKPGRTETRCITVSNDGPVPDGIRLIGGGAASGLGDYLRLTVEAGTGGHYGDCNGFTGAQVFDGSLGDFVQNHHDYDTGLVALTPSQSASTTFRLRVAVDDTAAAQGGNATASFAWEARTADIVVESPPPAAPEPDVEDTTPSPGPQLAAVEPDESAARATPASEPPKPDADPPAPDTPAADASPPAAAPPAAPATGGPALPDLGGTLADSTRSLREANPPRRRAEKPAVTAAGPQKPGAARRAAPAATDDRGLVETIAEAIVPVVQRTAFPLILLILGGLFLLIQNRIDSRDPKLARAPLHAHPDLPFLSPPAPGDAVA